MSEKPTPDPALRKPTPSPSLKGREFAFFEHELDELNEFVLCFPFFIAFFADKDSLQQQNRQPQKAGKGDIDTLYIGCEKFPYRDAFSINVSGVI